LASPWIGRSWVEQIGFENPTRPDPHPWVGQELLSKTQPYDHPNFTFDIHSNVYNITASRRDYVNRKKYRLDIQRLTRHQRKRIIKENLTLNYFVNFKDEFLSIESDIYHRCNKRLRLRSRIIKILFRLFSRFLTNSLFFFNTAFIRSLIIKKFKTRFESLNH
jgi:hypothetical protein